MNKKKDMEDDIKYIKSLLLDMADDITELKRYLIQEKERQYP